MTTGSKKSGSIQRYDIVKVDSCECIAVFISSTSQKSM